MISLEEAKAYLKVEHDEEDEVIASLLISSRALCAEVLRVEEEELKESQLLPLATLYGLAYLYEHREEADHKALKETLYHLLMSERKAGF